MGVIWEGVGDGCGEVGVDMVRWGWVGRCGCDMGGCEGWVQVMERVKIEGVKREHVWKWVDHIPTLICYIDHPSTTVSVKFRGRLQ